jgi:hypothetical protein
MRTIAASERPSTAIQFSSNWFGPNAPAQFPVIQDSCSILALGPAAATMFVTKALTNIKNPRKSCLKIIFISQTYLTKVPIIKHEYLKPEH